MTGLLRKVFFKTRLFFANEQTKAAIFSKYLGVKFGKNVRITDKPSFGSEPYLITIGNDVTITDGVIFHNHDGGVGILRKKYPGIDIIKPIKVGNNVFIGSRVIIMPGITIGNDIIIGAGSVITKDIPDGVVVVGVPGKIIRTVAEYEEKIMKDAIYIKNRDVNSGRKNEILKALKIK